VSAPPAPVPHRLRFVTPPGALISWPEAFGRRFLVSVDVEEEFDWSRPFSRAARSVAAVAALPAFHARLTAAGVAPVYLIDHPVAADPRAAATLRALDAEIGAQLHPWVNPPHEEAPSPIASFAGNLPAALEAAKLDVLVAAITQAIGTPPRAFRAGRYGLGPATLPLVAARGFAADLSMRARHDYRAAGGADFTRVGVPAFRLAEGPVELPLTTVFTGALRRAGARLDPVAARVPRGRALLARPGLLSRVPLTPEGVSAREAVAAIGAAAADGERLLHLAFHSPSLVPGNTPYVRDARDLARFMAWWDAVLPALAAAGYAPVSLDAVLRAVGPAGLEPAT
jgi:hypothetical protein